jgi:GR25 family glycosyltransferase involved in LPS biosynthesis
MRTRLLSLAAEDLPKQTTVASLLEGLTPEERADLHIAVLIAETDPNVHPSWHKGWIHQAVNDMYTYNASDAEKDHLRILKETGAYAEKGVYDYMHAMRRCYDTGAPYIGMFEDDILLADGWMVGTLQSLSHIPAVDDGHPWLFMRLFNQERSTGWASHRIGDNNEAWIILGIALGIAVPAFFARRTWHFARTYIDAETVAVVVLLLNPALVVLFFQCGKASLLPPRPGVFDEPFGCCSQAMVFPRTQVALLLDHLGEQRKGQIDLMLDQLAQEGGLTRYASYPVQAQHIGEFLPLA